MAGLKKIKDILRDVQIKNKNIVIKNEPNITIKPENFEIFNSKNKCRTVIRSAFKTGINLVLPMST